MTIELRRRSPRGPMTLSGIPYAAFMAKMEASWAARTKGKPMPESVRRRYQFMARMQAPVPLGKQLSTVGKFLAVGAAAIATVAVAGPAVGKFAARLMPRGKSLLPTKALGKAAQLGIGSGISERRGAAPGGAPRMPIDLPSFTISTDTTTAPSAGEFPTPGAAASAGEPIGEPEVTTAGVGPRVNPALVIGGLALATIMLTRRTRRAA